MYTDIKAELEDVQGAFCPGLEAPFGQLNIAFKRLVTPNALNPDGTVPPSVHPGLPWWDMMRYMWRGVASVRVRNLTAVLANTLKPHVRPRDERLALTAATLSVSVAAGRIDMTTTSITAHAHALPPDSSLGRSKSRTLPGHSALLCLFRCRAAPLDIRSQHPRMMRSVALVQANSKGLHSLGNTAPTQQCCALP
jgi:hypothetical protein